MVTKRMKNYNIDRRLSGLSAILETLLDTKNSGGPTVVEWKLWIFIFILDIFVNIVLGVLWLILKNEMCKITDVG
jgi:hypothetical protein